MDACLASREESFGRKYCTVDLKPMAMEGWGQAAQKHLGNYLGGNQLWLDNGGQLDKNTPQSQNRTILNGIYGFRQHMEQLYSLTDNEPMASQQVNAHFNFTK
jgi:hypothetical protein